MKKWLTCLLMGGYLLLGAVGWAQPQIPPPPTSGSLFVQDYAGVLSGDTKTTLSLLGSQLKGKTKAHVVLVTVKSLGGVPASDYALAILRQWGVGDKSLNNGVVILVAVEDRESRIEVGYGLEGRLNDAKVGRIQDQYMIPHFQQGDYDRGILNGYQAVVDEVAREYNVEIKTDAKPVQRAQPAASESAWDHLPWWAKLAIGIGILGLFLIDWIFFGGQFTWLILALLFRRGGGGGGGYGGGGFGGGSGGGGGAGRKW
ncbi:MAG TPA: TPM domain-containing protein [Selenomonadales bacterium]|nr:TPM domain-containing protein [Selenomonadales bacterium]